MPSSRARPRAPRLARAAAMMRPWQLGVPGTGSGGVAEPFPRYGERHGRRERRKRPTSHGSPLYRRGSSLRRARAGLCRSVRRSRPALGSAPEATHTSDGFVQRLGAFVRLRRGSAWWSGRPAARGASCMHQSAEGDEMHAQSNVRSGDMIENPVTGERLTFLEGGGGHGGGVCAHRGRASPRRGCRSRSCAPVADAGVQGVGRSGRDSASVKSGGHSAGREQEEGAMTDLPSPKFGAAAAEGRRRGWSSGLTRREPILLGLEFASTTGGGAEPF